MKRDVPKILQHLGEFRDSSFDSHVVPHCTFDSTSRIFTHAAVLAVQADMGLTVQIASCSVEKGGKFVVLIDKKRACPSLSGSRTFCLFLFGFQRTETFSNGGMCTSSECSMPVPVQIYYFAVPPRPNSLFGPQLGRGEEEKRPRTTVSGGENPYPAG